MSVKPVRPTLRRSAVLLRAAECLDASENAARAHEYVLAERYRSQAAALVEMLEEDDCGRAGGYDVERGQTYTYSTSPQMRLELRIKWLRDLPMLEEDEY